MKRRVFAGGAVSGTGLTGGIPMREFGKTGVKVSIIAQGGARMDLHPTVAEAAAHVRRVYEMGVTYFDCAHSYWDGKSEEAYGIGLGGVRKNIWLTSKSAKRTRAEAGKCRFIGFTGHYNPEAHAALLRAYGKWDSVMMPLNPADHAYLSFEQTALPAAVETGVGIQAIKIFGKAFLLRSLNPQECLRYALSMPVHVAICGAGTAGQMGDNVRTAQSFKPLGQEELADIRRRAIVGQGVYTGPAMEYWKMKA